MYLLDKVSKVVISTNDQTNFAFVMHQHKALSRLASRQIHSNAVIFASPYPLLLEMKWLQTRETYIPKEVLPVNGWFYLPFRGPCDMLIEGSYRIWSRHRLTRKRRGFSTAPWVFFQSARVETGAGFPADDLATFPAIGTGVWREIKDQPPGYPRISCIGIACPNRFPGCYCFVRSRLSEIIQHNRNGFVLGWIYIHRRDFLVILVK